MTDDFSHDSDFVVHNGQKMRRAQAAALQAAQAKTHYFVRGKVLPRIPYGNERFWPPVSGRRVCEACGTLRGQLHEPLCQWEQCPACAEQVVSCACGVLPGDAGGSDAGSDP